MGLELEDPDKIDWRGVAREVWRARLAAVPNLVTLVGVVVFGWKAMAVFLLFWLETVIVIVLETFLIAATRMPWPERIAQPLVFLLVCGPFCWGQIMMLIFVLARHDFEKAMGHGDPFSDLAAYMGTYDLLVPAVILAAMHVW